MCNVCMKTFATCAYKRKNRVSHDIRFSKTNYLKTNLLKQIKISYMRSYALSFLRAMFYRSFYAGKITNKNNSLQIFFLLFCLI